MKKLVLNRQDLVWESYETEWDAEDWADYVKWLGGIVEQHKNDNDGWYESQRQEYELIKDLTWDDVIEDFNKFEQDYEGEGCLFYEKHNSWKKEDGTTEEWTYKIFLHDIIREAMQEELYNNGPYDTEYADDYEESFTCEEVKENA